MPAKRGTHRRRGLGAPHFRGSGAAGDASRPHAGPPTHGPTHVPDEPRGTSKAAKSQLGYFFIGIQKAQLWREVVGLWPAGRKRPKSHWWAEGGRTDRGVWTAPRGEQSGMWQCSPEWGGVGGTRGRGHRLRPRLPFSFHHSHSQIWPYPSV